MPEELPLLENFKYETLESDEPLVLASSNEIFDKNHKFLALGFGEYFQSMRNILMQIDTEQNHFMPKDTSNGSCLKELNLGEFYTQRTQELRESLE